MGGNGNPGFDCSGLAHAAYAVTGVRIPRTADTQWKPAPPAPPSPPANPSNPATCSSTAPPRKQHTCRSLGGTLMIHAPDFDQVDQIANYRSFPDFTGVSRPAGA